MSTLTKNEPDTWDKAAGFLKKYWFPLLWFGIIIGGMSFMTFIAMSNAPPYFIG